MHGRSQAVRLPKEFRFEGREVRVSREGNRVILEPIRPTAEELAAVWAKIDALGDLDFSEPDDPPAEPDRRSFFDS